MPERHNHAAVAGVSLEGFDKALGELVAFYDPTVSGADSVSEFFWIPFPTLVFTIFGDFPFVPNFNAAFMEPADIIALLLVNPEHFKDCRFESDEFSSKDWKFFGEIELENLMRKTNRGGLECALGGVVWDIAFSAIIFAFVG